MSERDLIVDYLRGAAEQTGLQAKDASAAGKYAAALGYDAASRALTHTANKIEAGDHHAYQAFKAAKPDTVRGVVPGVREDGGGTVRPRETVRPAEGADVVPHAATVHPGGVQGV